MIDKVINDIYTMAMEKIAILGGGAPGKGYKTLRDAFRTMKIISDKYIPFERNTGKIKGRRQLEGMMGYYNTNPKYNDIIKHEGALLEINPSFFDNRTMGLRAKRDDFIKDMKKKINTPGELSLRNGQELKLPPGKTYKILGETHRYTDQALRDGMPIVKGEISQEDIEKYLDARHTLYKFYHPEATSTYNDPNKFRDRMHLLYEGWEV